MTTVETYGTLADAARALGSDAVYLGGGTLVMREVNAGRAPARVLRVTDPGLAEIRASGDAASLGAGVTMADVLAARELDFLHPVARVIGGPQVRNMATVAGNLFAAHPYGDFAMALLALGARVHFAGGGSPRPVEEVLRDRERGGLVASVEVPRPRDPRAFGFLKVSRVKPKGVSILSIAALLPREGGRIRGARVAFGAMGPTPLRAAGAERALEGQTLDAATIARAADQAADGLDPPTDALATAWYRREVAGVHLSRLLQRMERG
ncbi:xanthine dehydrogenase family protein subunit M [Rhodosalinus halophilus]|uniref:Xanthine dehydrogenase family protein subunit M n=1 Tax=Rhodosalinus halophilus TaxID=2259333 RepID=A0A365U847_9RHOB|nr:FAD binding domain-containing protein [Rhodosalinus halophilus]RBI84971.1 xanthine dehydrogenase family protein subunit M [Rhodosalinus halophilus]